MNTLASFFVPGKPAPQGSKRHVGRGRMIESSKYVGPWRERVALAAHIAMGGRNLSAGPIYAGLGFILPRAQSAPKTRHLWAIKQNGDIDKLERAVLDALTGICFLDDAQVVATLNLKSIALPTQTPGAWIHIEELE